MFLPTARSAEQKSVKVSNRKGIIIAIKDAINGKESRRHGEALSDLVNRVDDSECLAA